MYIIDIQHKRAGSIPFPYFLREGLKISKRRLIRLKTTFDTPSGTVRT
jgi:hypothetical protein